MEIKETGICMATVSFDKNITISEPKAVSKLIDALVNEKAVKLTSSSLRPLKLREVNKN